MTPRNEKYDEYLLGSFCYWRVIVDIVSDRFLTNRGFTKSKFIDLKPNYHAYFNVSIQILFARFARHCKD